MSTDLAARSDPDKQRETDGCAAADCPLTDGVAHATRADSDVTRRLCREHRKHFYGVSS